MSRTQRDHGQVWPIIPIPSDNPISEKSFIYSISRLHHHGAQYGCVISIAGINHQLWEDYQLNHFALSFRQGYHSQNNMVDTHKINQGIARIVVNIYILGKNMHYDKRLGMGPIPASPERYINEKQVDGLSILKKFGWKLICIRRPTNGCCETLMKNGHDKAVGILGEDGILRINPDIQIRHSQKG